MEVTGLKKMKTDVRNESLAYNIYKIVNSCVFYEGHKFISLWLLGATLFK